MRLNRLFVLSVVIPIMLLAPFLLTAGGGWTKDKGTAYYKVSHWWVDATKQFNLDGTSSAIPPEGIFRTSLFAEYGITNQLTGIINLPFSKSANDTESISGIGDTDIALKYQLNKPGSKFVLAGTVLFGLPFGNSGGGVDGTLQTGDGEFNQLVQLDLSRSFAVGPVNAYANVYLGFNNRSNNFSDEFRSGGELGASFIKGKVWVIARLDMIESLQNGTKSTSANDGATIFANNTEYVASTYEVAVYATKKIGISASYATVFDASLIFASPSYSLGFFLDLK